METCLQIIYEYHTEQKDKDYIDFTERVIGDVLMNKIKNNKLTSLSQYTVETIKMFYDIARKFSEKMFFTQGCNYIVYRGTGDTYNIDKNFIIQPIPFSTSLEKDNVYSWINGKCCIWKINIPLNTQFVCLNNPNEGKEIILPAGIINIKNIIKHDITTYICDFEPTNSFEESIELQKS